MNPLLNIIYNYIKNHISVYEDSKDVLQDTMLSIWLSLKTFTFSSSFKTWCIGITRRKIADYYRKYYKIEYEALGEYENELIAEDQYQKLNDIDTVDKVLSILNEKEKELIFLIFKAELSYSEISEITMIPIGTIKSTISRIKNKARKYLGEGR